MYSDTFPEKDWDFLNMMEAKTVSNNTQLFYLNQIFISVLNILYLCSVIVDPADVVFVDTLQNFQRAAVMFFISSPVILGLNSSGEKL